MKAFNSTRRGVLTLAGLFIAGQVIAFGVARETWNEFVGRLPVILAMVAFWGPICAIFSAMIVYFVLRLLGFDSLDAIRSESVDQNNPTPAILFVGTLISSVLFLLLIIRP
jgi:hypothetical protein